MKQESSTDLDATLAYHQRSKHHPHRFAASLGYLDWDTQPDPFRRFNPAPEFPLELHPVGPLPGYESAFRTGTLRPAHLDNRSIARLFQDSLGLSAWKQIPGNRWALRVNPSSGNLHPTEGYLVAPALPGLHTQPAVYHYAPREHLLELRTTLPDRIAAGIFDPLPANALLIGLTSIHWREAWKYGERAFRYCQHDVGHAIACIAVAAAGLGWSARLLDDVGDTTVSALLGVHAQNGIEAEHADGLIAVFPDDGPVPVERFSLNDELVADLEALEWLGTANVLSTDHHDWPAIDAVAAATKRPNGVATPSGAAAPSGPPPPDPPDSSLSLRHVIHQRRSAVAMDQETRIHQDTFYRILAKATPAKNHPPLACLGWSPAIDLLLFVHRVEGLEPGLYAHLRDPRRAGALQSEMHSRLKWTRPDGCPEGVDLFFLEGGDARHVAQQVSCNQAIAADGAFAVAMISDYRRTLEAYGPWFYRRLFWETGMIGQIFYLEAEAAGVRATGIGCYFDDVTHRLFGIEGDRFQVLYHFTVGGAVDDTRLETHPPYAHLEDRIAHG